MQCQLEKLGEKVGRDWRKEIKVKIMKRRGVHIKYHNWITCPQLHENRLMYEVSEETINEGDRVTVKLAGG